MTKRAREIRILPAVIGVGAILFVLKAGGLAFSANAAQTEAPPTPAPEAAPGAPAAPAAPARIAATAPGSPAPFGASATAAIDAARALPRFDPNAAPGSDAQTRLPLDLAGAGITAAQMDVLTRLGDRRDALDERQRQLEMQANVLAATEKRVDQKIAELKAIQAQIETLLDQRDANDTAQLDSLVRVYSAMKPREAARIFERLDGPVRISVAGKLKPDVLAGLLASLPPEVAQKLTVELANRYRMPALPSASPPAPGAAAQAASPQANLAPPAASPAAAPAAPAAPPPANAPQGPPNAGG